MPYKNDNLEELFQRAADDYPLRTNSSNWDSVAAKLNVPVTENAVAKKSNSWKYAAMLFFLIAGGALIYNSQFKSISKTKNAANSRNQKDLNVQQSAQTPKKNLNTNGNNSAISSKTNTALNNFAVTSTHDSKHTSAEYSVLKKTDVNDFKALTNLSIPNSNVVTQHQNQAPSPSILKNDKNNAGVNQNVNKNATVNNRSNNNKALIKYQQPLSKFYGSLYVGPEFSMIKSQHINKPGFKVGIALAYRINKRFDIEIGLQREWVNYYTSGQYFDKSGLNIKDVVALEDLNARSSLTNVPITVRYNFKSKNSDHFYAGVGFNTLVLTHTESYQYTVNKNGTENDHSKNYKSVTGPKYFTSINVSAGYQNKLSNWCNFKVEPYYQMPVGDLGVGKLPVTSFGINVGIVKNLK